MAAQHRSCNDLGGAYFFNRMMCSLHDVELLGQAPQAESMSNTSATQTSADGVALATENRRSFQLCIGP